MADAGSFAKECSAPVSAVGGVARRAVPDELCRAGTSVRAVVNGEVKRQLLPLFGLESQRFEGDGRLQRVALAIHIWHDCER